jgi:hypothetical protein
MGSGQGNALWCRGRRHHEDQYRRPGCDCCAVGMGRIQQHRYEEPEDGGCSAVPDRGWRVPTIADQSTVNSCVSGNQAAGWQRMN